MNKNFAPILNRALKNDMNAYQTLYEDTYGFYHSIVVKYLGSGDSDIEDVLQNAYTKIFLNLATLSNANAFLSWGENIVRNEAKNELRHRSMKKISQVQYVSPVKDSEEDFSLDDIPAESYLAEYNPEAAVDVAETTRLVNEILKDLPEIQRICISLWQEQKSTAEIADELGIPTGTVKSNISYAKKKVKERVLELEKQGTKLYGMAPIPFFLWLMSKYDLFSKLPQPGDMGLFHRIYHDLPTTTTGAGNQPTAGNMDNPVPEHTHSGTGVGNGTGGADATEDAAHDSTPVENVKKEEINTVDNNANAADKPPSGTDTDIASDSEGLKQLISSKDSTAGKKPGLNNGAAKGVEKGLGKPWHMLKHSWVWIGAFAVSIVVVIIFIFVLKQNQSATPDNLPSKRPTEEVKPSAEKRPIEDVTPTDADEPVLKDTATISAEEAVQALGYQPLQQYEFETAWALGDDGQPLITPVDMGSGYIMAGYADLDSDGKAELFMLSTEGKMVGMTFSSSEDSGIQISYKYDITVFENSDEKWTETGIKSFYSMGKYNDDCIGTFYMKDNRFFLFDVHNTTLFYEGYTELQVIEYKNNSLSKVQTGIEHFSDVFSLGGSMSEQDLVSMKQAIAQLGIQVSEDPCIFDLGFDDSFISLADVVTAAGDYKNDSSSASDKIYAGESVGPISIKIRVPMLPAEE